MSSTSSPTSDSRIYLDNNATTRPLPEVIEVLSQRFQQCFANPGSRHAEGRQARRVLEDARETIASILGARPSEVVFTSGGTESTNMAIFGLADPEPGTILLTAGEHPATLESCQILQQQGWILWFLPVDREGRLLLDEIETVPWQDIKMVTLILAHNETGVIQDVAPLSKYCLQHNIPFHLDAVQAVGKIPVDFSRLGVSSLALGAHKFHGPRGVGALLLRDGLRLKPYGFGGHQESGRRPGTEMVALAAGMAQALQSWHQNHETQMQQLRSMRDRLERGLQLNCPGCIVNGSPVHRLPNTLNLAFPGLDGEALLVALDLQGVACSLGSTCASGSAEPAAALVAMKCPPEVLTASVRFSLSIENTEDEIDEAIERIAAVVKRLHLSPAPTP